MSHGWSVCWSDPRKSYERTCASDQEVFDLLLDLHRRSWKVLPIVEIAPASSSHPLLSIAVGGKETVLTFDASPDPPYYISKGDGTREGFSAALCHQQQVVEQLATSMVPWDVGWQALREFLQTEQRPTRIEWEQV